MGVIGGKRPLKFELGYPNLLLEGNGAVSFPVLRLTPQSFSTSATSSLVLHSGQQKQEMRRIVGHEMVVDIIHGEGKTKRPHTGASWRLIFTM